MHAAALSWAPTSRTSFARRAAAPIKSYSPELIVHGVLREGEAPAQARERQADQVSKWFPALTALVVGPGLGRDETMQAVAALVVERAVAASLPLVIDADGLACVLRDPSLVRGSAWTVLTPNRPEFGRLQAALAPATPARRWPPTTQRSCDGSASPSVAPSSCRGRTTC